MSEKNIYQLFHVTTENSKHPKEFKLKKIQDVTPFIEDKEWG